MTTFYAINVISKMKELNIHLISDSSGETTTTVGRASIARFNNVKTNEYTWPLVRSIEEMYKVLEHIKHNPGIVLYTISDFNLRKELRAKCMELNVPCVSAIGSIVMEIANYLEEDIPITEPGSHLRLDDEYFAKIETFNFTMQHDDGQLPYEANKADILLFGVSRTSKSPTSFYLAHRGYKVANIPYIKDVEVPVNIGALTKPLIIGLTINPDRLSQIRQIRLSEVRPEHRQKDDYTSVDAVQQEVRQSINFFNKHRIPIIDVSSKAVEETAAEIIRLYNEKKID